MPRPLAHAIAVAALSSLLAGVPVPAGAKPFTQPADDSKLSVGGLIQPRIGYGRSDHVMVTDRLGFGLRRARIRGSASWGRATVEMDVDLVPMYPFALSVALEPAEGWTLRAGYFTGAQPRGMIYTGAGVIDGVDRAAIAERWAAQTLGGSVRDLGVDVTYANRFVNASVWLHSGLGQLDSNRSNLTQPASSNNATGDVDRTELAISGALSFTLQEGLEVGGFASYNPTGGAPTALGGRDEREVTSWSAHAYWGPTPGSQFLRLKAEVIGLSITDDAPPLPTSGPEQFVDRSLFGAAGTAAIGLIPHGEIFGRFEVFDEDDGSDLTRYLNAGVMFSLSAMDGGPFDRERLTLAYANTVRGDNTDHFVALQGQWLF